MATIAQAPRQLTSQESDELSQRQVKKHDIAIMLLHWFNAIVWLLELATGLALLTGTLRVMPTRWYQLKTNESAAVLPVEPEILELFRGWRAKAGSGFVIESPREPKQVNYQWYRCEAVFEYLLGWLRGKGVEGIKPFHALRKLYGSVLAERHGIHAASSGLRHADIRTTSEFYADRTVKLTAGFGSVLSGARVLPFDPSVAEDRQDAVP